MIPRGGIGDAKSTVPSPPSQQRLEAIVREHLPFVWRVLRRLGLSHADADDAAQRVLLTVARRLSDIEPGCERAFLSRTATHIALRAHRSQRRCREEPTAEVEAVDAIGPDPENLLHRRRTLAHLDALLDELPLEIRTVFVLFEIEGMSQEEVGLALDVPKGTVASRLRRARQQLARLLVSRKIVGQTSGGLS